MSQLMQTPYCVVPQLDDDSRKKLPQWVIRDLHGIARNPINFRIADVADPSTWSDYRTAELFAQTNPHRVSGPPEFVLTADDPFSVLIVEPAGLTDDEYEQFCEHFGSRQEKLPDGRTIVWFKESEATGYGGRLQWPSMMLELCVSQCVVPVGIADDPAHTAFEDRRQQILEHLQPMMDADLEEVEKEIEPSREEERSEWRQRTEETGKLLEDVHAAQYEAEWRKEEERRQPKAPWQRTGIDTGVPLPTGHKPAEKAAAAFDLEFPPGLLGVIAEYIYYAAPYPNKLVALAGAMAFMAGICGRAFNINGTGLNLYLALLAESGTGKEGAHSGVSKLCAALKKSRDEVRDVLGPREIASVPALLRRLSRTPSMYSHKGELGLWLQKLNHPRVNSNDIALRGLLLDLFHKSGHGNMLDGGIYADEAKNIHAIASPAFTWIGDSTPVEFFKAVDEADLSNGFLSRFMVLECPDERPVYNPGAGYYDPPKELIEALDWLIRNAHSLNKSDAITLVQEPEDAHQFQLAYQKSCQDKQWDNRGNPAYQIWSRAHIKLLRLGGLVAVGVNPDCPVIKVEYYQWAQKLIEHGIDRIIRRFESGDVGVTTLAFKQRQKLAEFLRDYVQSAYTKKLADTYRITKDMHERKVIPRSYIHRRLAGTGPFAKDPHGGGKALANILHDFVTAEILVWLAPLDGDQSNGFKKRDAYLIDESKLN